MKKKLPAVAIIILLSLSLSAQTFVMRVERYFAEPWSAHHDSLTEYDVHGHIMWDIHHRRLRFRTDNMWKDFQLSDYEYDTTYNANGMGMKGICKETGEHLQAWHFMVDSTMSYIDLFIDKNIWAGFP